MHSVILVIYHLYEVCNCQKLLTDCRSAGSKCVLPTPLRRATHSVYPWDPNLKTQVKMQLMRQRGISLMSSEGWCWFAPAAASGPVFHRIKCSQLRSWVFVTGENILWAISFTKFSANVAKVSRIWFKAPKMASWTTELYRIFSLVPAAACA